MVDWLAGKRVRGTSSERTPLGVTLGGTGVGGWVELGRTTLGSDTAATTGFTQSGFADKRYYMILSSVYLGSPGGTLHHRLGNSTVDTGSNYAIRYSVNGGADSTGTNQTQSTALFSGTYPMFKINYVANKSDKEKLLYESAVGQSAAGAANAPVRGEQVWKWTNTSNPLDVVHVRSSSGGGANYLTGSEVVVLGYDPTDTHTNNFWEELASVNADGSSTTLSSGTFTAKKYLWVQCYTEGTSADIYTNFNDVTTGSQYNRRYSIDGGSDLTNVSQNFIANMHNAGRAGEEAFSNWFIINNASNEKLVMGTSIQQGGTGAGNAPHRFEFCNKWANTSDQITKINFVSQTGNFGANSILKVWGAD